MHQNIVDMYIQNYTRKKKSGTYQTTYIAESYREDGKVKRRHLCNLTHLEEGLKQAICQAVYKYQQNNLSYNHLEPIQGKSVGALLAFAHLAKLTHITKALGHSRQGRLALFQIIARLVCQKSRLHSVSWAKTQAVKEILKLNYFNEDDLYENLDWLCTNQAKIEDKLFRARYKNQRISNFYLYDVTSSYLEGKHNELADFGYNRDKKKGKKQIVVGLMCDNAGLPISVQVFEGNTSDPTTIKDQIEKLSRRFRVKNIVMVGDRGMIKKSTIDQIDKMKWYYITAISKAQINTLLKNDVFQLELFTDELIEIEDEGIRYVLHRNPIRAEELAVSKAEKFNALKQLCSQCNQYLKDRPRAKTKTAIKKIEQKAQKLKIASWVTIQESDRAITLIKDEEKYEEAALLDGCYVIKSNMTQNMANKEIIHEKYKDLAKVEHAFRTFKTGLEELRPIYVVKESRTRGHVFVCMLAYILIKTMEDMCVEVDMTRQSKIDQLNSLQYVMYKEKNIELKLIPKTLNPELQQIVDALKLKIPSYV